MTSKKDITLSQLLPYDIHSKKNGNIRTGLKEYQTLLKAFSSANVAFLHSQLDQFDSLVGENACQIRAVWMALLASRSSVDIDALNKRIDQALNKIEGLLEPKSIDCMMRGDESLGTIIEKENLEIGLNCQEMFLIQSYLLSEMKIVEMDDRNLISIYRVESSDPKKLQRFGDTSTSFSRNLLSRLRRMLATASVEFVREHAPDCSKKMVSQEFTKEKNTLPCIPMFWTYKTLLKTAQSNNIPIVIHAKFLAKAGTGYRVVREERLLFKATQDGAYECSSQAIFDDNMPACVVQGIVTENADGELLSNALWAEKIKQQGVIDVILAGAADHRQYPDPAMDALIEALGDKEYENYKALAKSAGYSQENPTTFFIQHVYANRTRKALEANAAREETKPITLAALQELLFLNGPQPVSACN